MKRRHWISAAAGFALAGVALPSLSAASDYPNKSITMIVPFPAGGATDIQARLLAKLAGEKLGQSIVVVNRAGASGTLAPSAMSKSAKPDGYTISVVAASLFMQPHISAVMYDPLKDFSYISSVAQYGNGLGVHPDSKWKTLKDLVEEARSRPGEVSWGSAGASGGGRIIMEELQRVADVQFNFIPFGGGVEQFTQVAGKQIDAAADPGFTGLVKGNRVRLLAVFGDQRLANWPDVPTAKEAGYDMVYRSGWGVAGPAGMDQQIVKKLDHTIHEVMQTPEFRKLLDDSDFTSFYLNSEDFTAFAKTEYEQKGEVAKRLNMGVK